MHISKHIHTPIRACMHASVYIVVKLGKCLVYNCFFPPLMVRKLGLNPVRDDHGLRLLDKMLPSISTMAEGRLSTHHFGCRYAVWNA